MLISRKIIIASFFSGWFLIILHNNDKDDPAQENDDDRDVFSRVSLDTQDKAFLENCHCHGHPHERMQRDDDEKIKYKSIWHPPSLLDTPKIENKKKMVGAVYGWGGGVPT